MRSKLKQESNNINVYETDIIHKMFKMDGYNIVQRFQLLILYVNF